MSLTGFSPVLPESLVSDATRKSQRLNLKKKKKNSWGSMPPNLLANEDYIIPC